VKPETWEKIEDTLAFLAALLLVVMYVAGGAMLIGEPQLPL